MGLSICAGKLCVGPVKGGEITEKTCTLPDRVHFSFLTTLTHTDDATRSRSAWQRQSIW